MEEKKKIRIAFNAPVTLGFVGLCVVVHLLNRLTGGASSYAVFSVYRSSLLSPMTWLRCFCHVLGHMDWGHLINNMIYILLLGPMLEEKYGSKNMLFVMLATAFVTGILNMLVSPYTMVMGASGIVFAFILLASITGRTEQGTIPLSFILAVVLYIGGQIYDGLFSLDNISQLSHIVGGALGSVLGFAMNRRKMRREP